MPDEASAQDFIESQGLPFLAHLLRRVSDRMVADAGVFYARKGILAPARTASTLLLLAEQGPQSVTRIAEKLRQSHPLVITWLRQLTKLAFVATATDPGDARRTLVSLTETGREEAGRMAEALRQLGQAYQGLLTDGDAVIFDSLWRLDGLLAAGRLADHLRDVERPGPSDPRR